MNKSSIEPNPTSVDLSFISLLSDTVSICKCDKPPPPPPIPNSRPIRIVSVVLFIVGRLELGPHPSVVHRTHTLTQLFHLTSCHYLSMPSTAGTWTRSNITRRYGWSTISQDTAMDLYTALYGKSTANLQGYDMELRNIYKFGIEGLKMKEICSEWVSKLCGMRDTSGVDGFLSWREGTDVLLDICAFLDGSLSIYIMFLSMCIFCL